jgi:hypothetical protein
MASDSLFAEPGLGVDKRSRFRFGLAGDLDHRISMPPRECLRGERGKHYLQSFPQRIWLSIRGGWSELGHAGDLACWWDI